MQAALLWQQLFSNPTEPFARTELGQATPFCSLFKQLLCISSRNLEIQLADAKLGFVVKAHTQDMFFGLDGQKEHLIQLEQQHATQVSEWGTRDSLIRSEVNKLMSSHQS